MTDRRLRGRRRAVASIGLGLLAFSQLVIGGWALFTVYALPHTVFHGLHLHDFSLADAVAQMAGFVLQLGVVAVILLATRQPSTDRRSA